MLERPLDESYILTFLQEHKMAILSTVNESNFPDAAPIYYTVRYDFEMSFVTPEKTTKGQNIARQNHVVLTVTDEKKGETVQIRGIATASTEGLKEMYEHLGKRMNYSTSFIESLPALKHKDKVMEVVTVVPYEVRIRVYGVGIFSEKTLTFPAKSES
ncbi:pyridoxamine 5'-phosphate oxidase family protein [Candidatus Woesebacteria bacterium]|jgi:uncharacterized pyridoxamine 5'-phosphate oxidase family protein|nr:pyridoxamine 5'-phosphate oxidase family protein [Candidatus Woesebacteria bacterium]